MTHLHPLPAARPNGVPWGAALFAALLQAFEQELAREDETERLEKFRTSARRARGEDHSVEEGAGR